LDPMSPIINAVVAWNLTMARHFDAAIEQGKRTTQLFPAFMPGHAYLGLAYLEAGRGREAIAPFTTARKELDIPVFVTWLARAHLAAGDRKTAESLLRELKRKNDYLPAYYMASLYAHLGEHDLAFRELDRALQERTGAMVWVKVDPGLDPLRGDARFKKFVH
ncbi:MAG: tetratricopeptide repeat protein, partial [Thermoanaerobaculia bacterium]